MVEEASLAFRLIKTDETRNYLLDEIKHNDSISEKYKQTCKNLNDVEHLLILASTINARISISAFDSLVFVSVVVTGSAVGIKICAIRKKKKKKRDKIVLLKKIS